MRLGKRPGTFVAFVDLFTEETLLRVECDSDDVDFVSYHLFDCHGELVSDSGGARCFPSGVEVIDEAGELLLLVPATRGESIQYRLYSQDGSLLTCSDGRRTQIYGGVRIDGNRHLSGRPPSVSKT
jgi:hypothetical protein